MNPLMSEARILELIDKAHSQQKKYSSGRHDFNSIQFKIRVDKEFRHVYFSDVIDYWRQSHRLDEIPSVMFDLSLHQFYISNVKALPSGILRVTFKRCKHGRDTNYGADTIDGLMSVVKKMSKDCKYI